MEKNKKYLITGGTGFIGEALIERLMKDGFTNLVAVSRSEGNLVMLRNKFPSLEIITGDISDEFVVQKACSGVSGIFHVAAQKFLDLGEDHPRQCVRTNILGTMNILDYTIKHEVEFVVGVSTDKTVSVNSVYAATKLIFEKLFQEYEQLVSVYKFGKTKYKLVRFGNVVYSTGSVLCKWKDSIQRGQPINITDPNATRFFWNVDGAVNLILDSLINVDAKPSFVGMKSIRIGTLLGEMLKKYGNVQVNEIGLQPGETLHERIDDTLPDSSQAERFTQKEIELMI